MEELRLYTFVNGVYMKEIQWGIQSGHLADSMTVRYILEQQSNGTKEQQIFRDWIRNHKTYIVLNAVNMRGILDAYSILEKVCPELQLPYGVFYEDEDSLGGIITCCGVVVPEKYFNAVKLDDGYYYNIKEIDTFGNAHADFFYGIGSAEYELIDLIKSKRLA